jgi:hypothetical protein
MFVLSNGLEDQNVAVLANCLKSCMQLDLRPLFSERCLCSSTDFFAFRANDLDHLIIL